MIYCDNSATTQISEPVLQAMEQYLTDSYGNASSVYSFGCENRKAITKAREQVAKAINADPTEIYFTSCGSEADNWAIRGVDYGDKKHIIISEFEHPAVYNTCDYMSGMGYKVTHIKPDRYGIISTNDIIRNISNNTRLVSVMAVNNEIGTIQDIKSIGKLCHESGVLFHTDAVQAIGHIAIDVKDMNIDMLSMSGHKFHAPKGIGVLYVSKDVKIKPLIFGGGQEFGKRAGTENVASIVGLGKAIEIATENLSKQAEIAEMRNVLWNKLKSIGGIEVNGDMERRIANNLNISIDGTEGESMVLMLDTKGVCVSAGSACCSGSIEPSRTLTSIGIKDENAYRSIRISLGDDITATEIDTIYNAIKEITERMRRLNVI